VEGETATDEREGQAEVPGDDQPLGETAVGLPAGARDDAHDDVAVGVDVERAIDGALKAFSEIGPDQDVRSPVSGEPLCERLKRADLRAPGGAADLLDPGLELGQTDHTVDGTEEPIPERLLPAVLAGGVGLPGQEGTVEDSHIAAEGQGATLELGRGEEAHRGSLDVAGADQVIDLVGQLTGGRDAPEDLPVPAADQRGRGRGIAGVRDQGSELRGSDEPGQCHVHALRAKEHDPARDLRIGRHTPEECARERHDQLGEGERPIGELLGREEGARHCDEARSVAVTGNHGRPGGETLSVGLVSEQGDVEAGDEGLNRGGRLGGGLPCGQDCERERETEERDDRSRWHGSRLADPRRPGAPAIQRSPKP
jgi:hypothetical protein